MSHNCHRMCTITLVLLTNPLLPSCLFAYMRAYPLARGLTCPLARTAFARSHVNPTVRIMKTGKHACSPATPATMFACRPLAQPPASHLSAPPSNISPASTSSQDHPFANVPAFCLPSYLHSNLPAGLVFHLLARMSSLPAPAFPPARSSTRIRPHLFVIDHKQSVSVESCQLSLMLSAVYHREAS